MRAGAGRRDCEMNEPSIYDLAIEHIQPASGDKALVRQYVDAAVQMVQDMTGLAISNASRRDEIVIPIDNIERPPRPLFHVPAHSRRAGGKLRLRMLADPVTVDVYLIQRNGKRHYIGKRQVVDGELCLDPVEDGCCLDDCSVVAIRVPPVTDNDWPPQVKQAVLQIAKWLYEHRGDAVDRRPADIIAASGAGQLLAGYMQ